MSGNRPAAAATVHSVRRLVALLVAAVTVTSVSACSSKQDQAGPGPQQQSEAPAPSASDGTHGPLFPECGGVSDETIAEQTRVTGLVKTAVNSVGCQWLAGGGILGPHFSFTWYRGSPIGRERKTEELSRTSVEDINIEGHDGWVAVGTDPVLGDNLCEIAIGFGDDFIEWSINFNEKPFPPPCDVAKELARQSIVNAK